MDERQSSESGEPSSTDARTSRPPYRVPTMEEIAAVRGTNGLKFVSTFSGCGGSCLGFEMAGWKPLYACEFIDEARRTYEQNHPGVFVDGRDIREVTPEDIMKHTGLAPGELDVLEGSPPCSSFSMAGSRSEGWDVVKKYSDKKQRTDDLFFEYVRLLRGLRPRAFIAENVPGLVQGVAKGYFKMILKELIDSGYRVEARVLDAQWLGVPQARRRLIFIGMREDLGIDPVFPRPLRYNYSVRDAIGDLVDGQISYVCNLPSGNTGSRLQQPQVEDSCVYRADFPVPAILASYPGRTPSQLVVIPEGDGPSFVERALMKEWRKLIPGQKSGKYLNLVKPDARKPLPTVTAAGGSHAGTASVTHPTQPRKFTIAELRRLCSFPDDFILTGKYSQQWERLGRAVPPVMMMNIAATLAKALA
jgi:DNA (cytosine-5)-methyltransferase 1